MTAKANHVRVATETTGTGTVTLGAAPAKFFTFAEAGISDGQRIHYKILEGDSIEFGIGTYTASGTTLSRDEVYLSRVAEGAAGTDKLDLAGAAVVTLVTLAEDWSWQVEPEAWGAVGDAVLLEAGNISGSNATFTDAGASFTAADVGKTITVIGAGAAGANLVTTISSINSGTSIELASLASTTVTGTRTVYGTDCTAAFAAAFSAATARSAGVRLVADADYLVDSLTIPDRLVIYGRGARIRLTDGTTGDAVTIGDYVTIDNFSLYITGDEGYDALITVGDYYTGDLLEIVSWGDHREVTDGVSTNSDATLTSAAANFTSADVGKDIAVKGAGDPDGVLTTTIASINSESSIEMADAAGSSGGGTGRKVIIGTRQYSPTAIQIHGDGVRIGMIRTRNISRPVHLGDYGSVGSGPHYDCEVGFFDFTNVIRGLRIEAIEQFHIGGGRVVGGCPIAFDEPIAGNNGILVAGAEHGEFGHWIVDGVAEHAIRLAANATTKACRDLHFGHIRAMRTGGAAFKCNADPAGDADGERASGIVIDSVFGLDIGDGVTGAGKSPEGLRLSHLEYSQIGDCTFAIEDQAWSCTQALAMQDVRFLQIGKIHAPKVKTRFIDINDGNDASPNDVNQVYIAGIYGAIIDTGNDAIRVDMDSATLDLRDVYIADCMLDGWTTAVLNWVDGNIPGGNVFVINGRSLDDPDGLLTTGSPPSNNRLQMRISYLDEIFQLSDPLARMRGMAQAWAHTTNDTVVNGYNVTSVVDDNTDEVTLTLAITMASNAYAAQAASTDGVAVRYGQIESQTTTAIVATFRNASGDGNSPSSVNWTITGDRA